MAPTVAAPRRPREVQALDPQSTLPLIGSARGPSTVHPVDGDWILPLACRAIDRVMSRKDAALTMGKDQSQLARELSADGHLSIRRLGLLPEDFWRAFIDELRAHFHMDNDAERLRRALDALQASVSVIGEIAVKAVGK